LNVSLANLASELLMRKGGKSIGEVQKEIMRRLDPQEAANRVANQLPEKVAALVKLAEHGKKGDLNDEDIERAILILNGLIQDAWVRLDAKVTECKEFEARNRDTYEQVMIDLARLGSQIAAAEGERTQALTDLAEVGSQIKLVNEAKEEAHRQYQLVFDANSKLLQERESERAVWNYIMQITNCATFGDTYVAEAFVQTSKMNSSKICLDGKNQHHLIFDDPVVQKKLESLMTPTTRKTLDLLLSKHVASLVQGEPYDPTVTTPLVKNSSESVSSPIIQPTTPVNKKPHAGNGQWKKCSPGEPDCGLLHDTISLQWGSYRDLVDDLKHEMAKNGDAWSIQLANFNDQLRILRDAEKKANEELADAIKRITVDTEEKNKKNGEKLELTAVYTKTMAICRAEIGEIMFTFICGIRVTRDVLVREHSSIETISDCDVTDWNPGPCSVDCDDTCPVLTDRYACGGMHTLTREIVNIPDQWGVQCPILTTQRKCNQKKCPVDCVMSAWSGFSACSKECGGGLQSQTRSILIKPKNGGQSCPANSEERACHTFSCDRDCLLSPWQRWSGCSMACGGGTRYRKKLVIREIRGNGACPLEASADRFFEEECNAQACIGDEVCIAEQDLVLTIDASGSLKQFGFEALQKFAAALTYRYFPKYYGREAMKVGAVEFGNGAVSPEGVITPAQQVHELTHDIEAVRTSIESMTWLRGFTNMAQALTKADTLFTRGSRRESHSGVLLITDGRPSLIWSTRQKIKALKDKNTMVYVAMVSSSESDQHYRLMQEFASTPWNSNMIRIPSHKALHADPEPYVQKAISKFCPNAMSPNQNQVQDLRKQYMLVYSGGYPSNDCGSWHWVGYLPDMDACAAAAREMNQQGFAWGSGERENGCYSEAIPVTQQIWEDWVINRQDPPCPNGAWIQNEWYDTYIINPESIAENEGLTITSNQ